MEGAPALRRESSNSAIAFAVKLVALWQFVKSAGLALILCGIWPFHQSTPVSGSDGGQVEVSENATLIILGLIILDPTVVGLGIWNLQRWARWLLLPTFALTAPWWAMRWMPDAYYFDFLRDLLPRSMVPVVATLDVLSILALLLPDVRKAFGDRDEEIEDGSSPWA